MQGSSASSSVRWLRQVVGPFALVLLLVAGATDARGQAPAPSAHELIALEILDGATQKLDQEPPGEPTTQMRLQLAYAVAHAHGASAVKLVRRFSDEEAKKPRPMRPGEWGLQAGLAGLAAPHDGALRDLCLKRAGVEARAALAQADLWKADPDQPAGRGGGNPQTQRDREKMLVTLLMELWEHVILGSTEPAAARAKITRLLADPRAQQAFQGCVPRTVQSDLSRSLASLDARLLVDVLTATWPEEQLARHTSELAYHRHVNRQRDSFTKVYILHAATHGVSTPQALGILKEYDFAKALDTARQIPPEPDSTDLKRMSALCDVIGELAWRDPDAALAAAEAEADDFIRRQLIDDVSLVWAVKRPEQIERAIKNQDTPVRQEWARERASKEIVRKKQGLPPSPRLRPGESVRPTKAELTPAETAHRKEMRKRLSAEENRVLENPGDLAWLEGPARLPTLHKAAWQAYYETLSFESFDKIVAGLKEGDERDAALQSVVQQIASWGDPAHLPGVLKQIRSSQVFLRASIEAARSLVRR